MWGDQYYSYSVCIFVITWFSIITSAVESYRNRRRLADIAHFETWVGGGSRASPTLRVGGQEAGGGWGSVQDDGEAC